MVASESLGHQQPSYESLRENRPTSSPMTASNVRSFRFEIPAMINEKNLEFDRSIAFQRDRTWGNVAVGIFEQMPHWCCGLSVIRPHIFSGEGEVEGSPVVMRSEVTCLPSSATR